MNLGPHGVFDYGVLDPALWAALAVCGFLAWSAGKGIGHQARRLRHRRSRNLVAVAGCVLLGPSLTILTRVVFELLYRAAHDRGDRWTVSDAFTFPLFVAPTLLLCASTYRAVKRGLRTESHERRGRRTTR